MKAAAAERARAPGVLAPADSVRQLPVAATILYDLPNVQEILRLAAGRGLAVTLLQILSPEGRAPEEEGEYLLTDLESGTRLEITLNPAAYLAYLRRLEAFYRELDDSCRCWGAKRVLLDSGEAATKILFKTLPRAGVLQPGG